MKGFAAPIMKEIIVPVPREIIPAAGQIIIDQAAEDAWDQDWNESSYMQSVRPFDHVIGNLYIGGITEDLSKFKYIFCLTADRTYRGGTSGEQIIHLASFEDDPRHLPPEWFINDVVDRVLDCTERGPTYVHCTAGLNRSGMIVALCLVERGWGPKDAIDMLRGIRSQHVLNNPLFFRRVITSKPRRYYSEHV